VARTFISRVVVLRKSASPRSDRPAHSGGKPAAPVDGDRTLAPVLKLLPLGVCKRHHGEARQ
jgi:hypothetical protein